MALASTNAVPTNEPGDGGQDLPSIQGLEAPFDDEGITRVDCPNATISSPRDQSATDHSAVPPNAKVSGTRMRRALVLIAHDSAHVCEELAHYLRMTGLRVVRTEHGSDPVSMARERTPDAIVLDYVTRETEGVQAALSLKRDESTRDIPILMLTAARERAERILACDAYLDAPCDAQTIAIALHSLLETAAARASAGAVR